MNNLAPICLFVYNRLDHTKQTVAALQKNNLASESILYIFSDGPKEGDESGKVEKVRHYIKTIGGFKDVKIIESITNKGLANSVINGVTEVVNRYGKIIVLEDDLVTSKYFLEYMNSNLELYENDKDVISIHGYVLPVKGILPNFFFLKGADCWGWATRKRGWDLFENDGKRLLRILEEKGLTYEFDFWGSTYYTKMLKNQILGKNNSWAIRRYASAFIQNKLTLYPGQSYIQNIGLDASGTHCGNDESYKILLKSNNALFEKISIKEDTEAKVLISNFFRTKNISIKNKLINLLRRFLFKFRVKNVKF